MRLIVLQAEAMIADVVCGKEAIYIGSADDARVQLADTRIPARLAVVFPDAQGAWVLEPLNDDADLSHNNSTVTGRTTLSAGDELRILDYTLRVYPDYEERAGTRATASMTRAQMERFAQAKLPPGAILKRADELISVHPQQLNTLARSLVNVSGWATVEELMDASLHTLLGIFAAQRAWIGIRRLNYGPMEYEEGRLIAGAATDLPAVAHELKPRILDRGQNILIPLLQNAERVSILAGPLVGPEGNLGMVYVDSGDSGRRFDSRDLDMFILVLSGIGHHLHAIFQSVARARAAMVAGQVSVAHEIQARLTPRQLPQSEQLQFGVFREMGREHSGDIYDVVRLPNNLVTCFVAQTRAVGGLPSMLMAQAQTAFRYAAMHQDTPNILLRSLNWMLFDGQKDHPLDCFTAAINPANGQMRYSLAGALGAFIISARGEERPLASSEPAPALGLAKSANFPLLSECIGEAETLVVFTSGVTTARNRQNETFGEERFVNILCDGFGQQASAALKEMLTDLRNFTEGGVQPEDITVLLAHRP